MLSRVILILAVTCFSTFVSAATLKVDSKNDLKETTNRFIAALVKAEIPVRSQKKVKKALPGGFSQAGEEIVFSNPFFGWNLGECHRGLRKDKPMTATIWKGTTGQVWLEYDQPDAITNSFGVIECGNETDKVQSALHAFVDTATE